MTIGNLGCVKALSACNAFADLAGGAPGIVVVAMDAASSVVKWRSQLSASMIDPNVSLRESLTEWINAFELTLTEAERRKVREMGFVDGIFGELLAERIDACQLRLTEAERQTVREMSFVDAIVYFSASC